MEVTFQQHPIVVLGSNRFVNVPTIIQFEDIPLLEVGKFVEAGFTSSIKVYDSQGVYIAKVVGSRIHLTDEGKKANVKSRHEHNLIVCTVEDKPILELRRDGAAALSGWAELHATDGYLVKSRDDLCTTLLQQNADQLQLGQLILSDSEFTDFKVGLLFRRNGAVGVGLGGGIAKIGLMTMVAPPKAKQ